MNIRASKDLVQFYPNRNITQLDLSGLQLLSQSDITPEAVGQKAYGLACIPESWVPPFCVISHSLASKIAGGDCSRAAIWLRQIPWFQEVSIGLMLRSSAVDETMEERGSLVSEQVTPDTLFQTLSDCVAATLSHGKIIHWILQIRVHSKIKGHLSNERRVAKAKRDWVVDFEMPESSNDVPLMPISLAVRNWRHGAAIVPTILECASYISIDQVLRLPAQWATERKIRIHFEWVWDGSNVWLVQGDLCIPKEGTDPRTLLPNHVSNVQADNLQNFRAATASDFNRYRKLSNAKLYMSLGYQLPAFYVLEDREVINDLICGKPCESVTNDLLTLVSQPLVIRTDGEDLPLEMRQMLPRSDELRTVESVINWFSHEFPQKLAAFQEYKEQLVFICHHFVPALASAWSMAEPKKRVVRTEALWGIPEGMYWYGHDAFEVDTGNADLSAIANDTKFRYSRRERYKEWFIAPDIKGVWCAHRTGEPFDWKTTISDNKWLSEIAITSREIAEKAGFPVNVMWFLGVHPDASRHTILPWYHEKSELDRSALKGAPRFKRSDSTSIELHTQIDWERLTSRSSLDLGNVKRITVSPRDSSLIRSKEFLNELAEFANQRKAIIELMGGVLAHVFYILQRAGCNVEIFDLFGAKEENLVFKKVVRDKIPDSIAAKGELVTQIKIMGEELVEALKTKLIEEALEVVDAKSTSETIEELADVLEVIHALAHHLKISMKQIEDARKTKRQDRGGFNEGKVLVKTTGQTSLTSDQSSHSFTLNLFEDDSNVGTGAIILEPDIRLHQDEREVAGIRERILEIGLPTVLSVTVVKETAFHLSVNSENGVSNIPLIGEWSIVRNKSDSKIRLTIKSLPVQAKLELK